MRARVQQRRVILAVCVHYIRRERAAPSDFPRSFYRGRSALRDRCFISFIVCIKKKRRERTRVFLPSERPSLSLSLIRFLSLSFSSFSPSALAGYPPDTENRVDDDDFRPVSRGFCTASSYQFPCFVIRTVI